METEAEIERLRRLVEATAEALGGASPRTLKEAPFRRFGRQYNTVERTSGGEVQAESFLGR